LAGASEPLLNLAEAATQLHMGQSTLRQKIYAGLGPIAIKLPGSDRWRFRPSDLKKYVRAGEISPMAKAEAKNGEAA
jgi:Helix-turn-helix domain